MDTSSDGETPAQPPSPSAPTPASADRQFTVPVPAYSPPTQTIPTTPTGGPPPAPWGGGADLPPPSGARDTSIPSPYAAGTTLGTQAPSDAESLRNLSLVLMGVVIGFWVFVLVRVMAYLVEVGATDRLLIETIDATAVETIAAALIALLATAGAVSSRLLAGRRVGGALVWATAALALVTVVTAIWRLV